MAEVNLAKQLEEVEAVKAIYDNAVTIIREIPPIVSVCISEEELEITLRLSFPEDYPTSAPPTYELSAAWMRRGEKASLEAKLQQTYVEHTGENIAYLWIEVVREFLQNRESAEGSQIENSTEMPASVSEEVGAVHQAEASVPCPNITHGGTLSDRRSVFQPHLAPVTSQAEVKAVLSELMSNKKIADATHNIYAFRIVLGTTQSLGTRMLEDYEDDGEHGASKRMLHLMQKMEVENVLVVVTRWYGGVHLGPDRFRHINTLASEILEHCGYRKEVKKSTSKGKKTKTKT